MARALSGEDILNHPVVRKHPITLMAYPGLNRMTNIDQLFGNNTAAIVLYNVRQKNDGHWVLLIKHLPNCRECTQYRSNYGPDGQKCAQGVIEFFDPYGSPIDFVLQMQDATKRRVLDQPTARLSRLLGQSPYCIVYNDRPVQKQGPAIETCGHHCLARLSMRHMDVDKYVELMRAASHGNVDHLVSQLYDSPLV